MFWKIIPFIICAAYADNDNLFIEEDEEEIREDDNLDDELDDFEFDAQNEADGNNVLHPDSLRKFDGLVHAAEGAWILAYFYRPNCYYCNKLKSVWREITTSWNLHKKRSKKLKYVRFVKVNRTENPEIFEKYKGDNNLVPYFVFFKNGKRVFAYQSSDPATLKYMMRKNFGIKKSKY